MACQSLLSISNHPVTCILQPSDDSDAVAVQPKGHNWTRILKPKVFLHGIFDVLAGIKHCLMACEPVIQWLIGSSTPNIVVTSEKWQVRILLSTTTC